MAPPSILDLPEDKKRSALTRMGVTEAEYREKMARQDRELDEAIANGPEPETDPSKVNKKWLDSNDPEFEFHDDDGNVLEFDSEGNVTGRHAPKSPDE